MPVTRRDQLRDLLLLASQRITDCPQAPLSVFEENLHRWAMRRCVFRDGFWGGIGGLHLDYVKWCEEVAEVPCSQMQFREWLLEGGFHVSELDLVYGVILRVDDEFRSTTVAVTKE
jgi:hypothetical protein